GIEYGLMQAYAEGFSILQHKREFELDLHQIAEIWRYGSVVRSWLLDLTADALDKNPRLQGIAPYVADSGEGRWTVSEAIELGVPAIVITASLLERFRSRDSDSFVDKLLAAMRNQFGGHEIKKEERGETTGGNSRLVTAHRVAVVRVQLGEYEGRHHGQHAEHAQRQMNAVDH